jgi:subtilisin family serine protease
MQSLMNVSSGHKDITIGIIDGPVDFSHPAFQGSKIRTAKNSQVAACRNASSMSCVHGTFVTGILCAKRGLSAPAICPDCEIILNPIFMEGRTNNNNKNKSNSILPSATPEELSHAIIETIDSGAKIINLSLGLSTSSLTIFDRLQMAYDYALQKGVVIIVAAGNQGNIGNISLIKHQWTIPVTACCEDGRLDPASNFGPSIGNRGLMAPGVNIRSTYPEGQYAQLSGTSFAAPFVTGAIALLWSIFQNATAAMIIHSIMRAVPSNRHSIIPPILNAEAAWDILKTLK